MKIKKGFLMREVAGKYVVVPVGTGTNEFKGMVQMNKIGAFLWSSLDKDQTLEELVQKILEKYDVTEEQAVIDVEKFIGELLNAGILEK